MLSFHIESAFWQAVPADVAGSVARATGIGSVLWQPAAARAETAMRPRRSIGFLRGGMFASALSESG